MHMLNNESLDVFVNKTSVKKRQIVFVLSNEYFVLTLNKYFLYKETNILVRECYRKREKFDTKER